MRALLLLLVFALGGCAGMPANAPPLDAARLSQMGIRASDIQQQETSLFGITSLNSRVAELRPAHVLLTPISIQFITLTKDNVTYRKELSLPLSRVDGAALVRYGNLGHMRQIHLRSDVGLVVMSFGFGETERAEKFFDGLKAAGLRVEARNGYVRSATDSPAMVPIFIPSR